MSKIQVTVNGEKREINTGTDLITLINSLNMGSIEFGVAASLNGVILAKESWNQTILNNNDNLEIIKAFQGG